MNGEARFDAVFDVVGKTPLKQGLALLYPGGAYLHFNPKISQMIFRRFYAGSDKTIVFKTGEQTPADLQYLADLMATREVMPLIDRIMPLDDIIAAHRYVEAGRKKGNLVIAVGQAH
ncbi:MAG: zinc-binding dehydrogenase [Firmicutes bacterium]|nr:zinc-binding dehydrogenase [Bacillota bacterium]